MSNAWLEPEWLDRQACLRHTAAYAGKTKFWNNAIAVKIQRAEHTTIHRHGLFRPDVRFERSGTAATKAARVHVLDPKATFAPIGIWRVVHQWKIVCQKTTS